ncbi:TPA: amino acid adenylation domain-containing protein, partial [Streptococcus agalactiae]|nr:amino acid adenylation domain-containing protein [Streptococcus agalactiae]
MINRNSDSNSIKILFNREISEKLVTKSNYAFNTDISDLILTALSKSVKDVFNKNAINIDIETHGRENIDDNLDLSRTIGWFTSCHPVLLDVSSKSLKDNIISVKETRRKVPNKGIGYLILKMNPEIKIDFFKSDIAYNFFGIIKKNTDSCLEESPFKFADSIAVENGGISNGISVNGYIYDGELVFEIYFDTDRFSKALIGQLCDSFKKNLIDIINYCTSIECTIPTFSDFKCLDLNNEEMTLLKSYTDIEKIEKISNLTSMQEGMLFEYLSGNNTNSDYVIQLDLKLTGKINYNNLKKSIELLSSEHEVLRTCFINTLSKPKQIIFKDKNFEIEEFIYEKNEEFIEKLKEDDLERGFNLLNGDLIRVKIIKISEEEYRIIWSFHHIILDGWSLNIINKSFLENYKRLTNEDTVNQILEIYDSKINFSDFIDTLNAYKNFEGIKYFKELLAGYENITELPTEIKENVESEKLIKDVRVDCSSNFMDKVVTLASEFKTTQNTLIESAFGVLLQKYNYTDDVVFGKIVSGRNNNEIDVNEIAGLFVNTLPSRVKSHGEMRFKDLIKQMNIQNIELTKFEQTSLAEIQNNMIQKQDLIKILYVFENYELDPNISKEMCNLNFEMISYREEVSYDLLFTSGYTKGKLYFKVAYNSLRYSEDYCLKFIKQLEYLIDQVYSNIEIKINQLSTLLKEDKKIIEKINDNERINTSFSSIAEMFEETRKYSNVAAISCKENEINYEELHCLSDGLALKLRKIGVKKGDFVGICQKRDIEMIVSLMAVIKLGAVYVPVDPNYPDERKLYIINDCKLKYILIDDSSDYSFIKKSKINKINVYDKANYLYGDFQNEIIEKSDPLYMLYTSGSTGKPKGVLVANKTILNLISFEFNQINYRNLNVLFSTNLCFDVATQEILFTLLGGSKGFIIDEEIKKDMMQVCEYINENNINAIFTTPSYFDILTSTSDSVDIVCTNLKEVFLAGEEFYINNLTKKYASLGQINFRNDYGPTETHVVTTNILVNEENKINIGKPISNTKIHILNEYEECGINMPGELCIEGESLAIGYFNNDKLTGEKFITWHNKRIYKTGDLAKWNQDGSISYLGRIDKQVKIRGYRVELGEIEDVIRQIVGVKDVCVITSTNKVKTLHAFIVTNNNISKEVIKSKLSQYLPEYMIPQINLIDKIPLTSNGKVDRRSLKIVKENVKVENETINDDERILIDIFSDILEIENIGINDSFFEFGGHSLKAMRLINSIERAFKVKITFNDVFKYPKVKELSKIIRSLKINNKDLLLKATNKELYKMSSAQKRMYYMNKFNSSKTTYNIPMVMKYDKGVLEANKLKRVFNELISRHEILRTTFHIERGIPVQKIHEEGVLDFECIKANEYRTSDFISPFTLEKLPLFRVKLIDADMHSYLFIDMHHIISDGRSYEIIFDEFNKLYNGIKLEKLEYQYRDYSENIKQEEIDKQEKYWIKKIGTDYEPLVLPLDHSRSKLQAYEGKTLSRKVGKKLSDKLRKFSETHNTTEFILLLSAVMILLNEYSKQNEILIGTPVSGRTSSFMENIVGLFVNTLVIKSNVEKKEKYLHYLRELTNDTIEAYDNQNYPFDSLVDKLKIKREMSRNPIFDVMFTFQNQQYTKVKVTDREIKLSDESSSTTHFDLSISIMNSLDGYIVGFEYSNKLFDATTIKYMVDHFINILDSIVKHPNSKIGELESISDKEKSIILNDFNNTERAYQRDSCISELLDENVRNYGENIALTKGGVA